MLKCGRCGSGKFFFTTTGDAWGQHHGARCAVCHKCLCARDTKGRHPIDLNFAPETTSPQPDIHATPPASD